MESISPVLNMKIKEHIQNQQADHMQVRFEISENFQIKAVDAVACALLAFAIHWNDPEEAVIQAVAFGGNTDTVASMTGNLAFALWGYEKIPTRWLDNLENKDQVINLCGKLVTYYI